MNVIGRFTGIDDALRDALPVHEATSEGVPMCAPSLGTSQSPEDWEPSQCAVVDCFACIAVQPLWPTA